MRRLSPALAVVLIASIAFQGSPTTAASACKRLTDDDSKFAGFLRDTVGVDDNVMETIMTAFEPLDTAAPWLSSCVASIDPMTIFSTTQMSSGYKACEASINGFEMPDQIDDKSLRQTICPFYGETLMPCANNVGVQALMDALAGAGSCCDGLKTQMKTWFGTDIKTMVADLLNKFGAAVCTIKTFEDSTGATQSETCLWSMVTSFMTQDTIDYLPVLMQMPTDQVCKAVTGQPFITTAPTSTRFKWVPMGYENFGICYEPLSELFKLVGAYPVVATPMAVNKSLVVSMADAFVPGKCLLSDNLFQWMQDKDSTPMVWARTVDEVLASLGYSVNDLLYDLARGWDEHGSSDGSWGSWGSSSGSWGWWGSSSGSSGWGWDASNWWDSDSSSSESWDSPNAGDLGSTSSDQAGSTWSSWGSWGSSGESDLPEYNATTLLEAIIDGMRDESPKMCVHFASGQKCDYDGATMKLAYKTAEATPAPTTTPTATKATTTSTSAAGALPLGSVLLGIAFATCTATSLLDF